MLFSFVIPTYNRAKKVTRAIDSVLNQPDWAKSAEIIVVDDGSNDDTALELQKYLGKDQIRLINHSENLGVAKAKNTGIINARNEFVVLLDSDDLLTENGLDYLTRLVVNHDSDMFFCGTQILNSTKLMYDPSFRGLKSYYNLLKTPVGEYLPVCKTHILKNNLLNNLRGYESITWLTLAKKGCRIYFDGEPIRLYDNIGEDRLSNRFNGIKNSARMREGYSLYLKEFGADLKYFNYPEYLKMKLKLMCYYLMSLSFK
ncbi:MAG TPA: glycosyltransferase family 2 protein [Sphingobacteriaceae bacterium]